jgi:hypothetical protein
MELLYGSDHHRLRALTILDVLIQNAGETFQKNFADTKLADGLDKCLKCSNPAVREKCAGLMRGWSKYDAHIARTYKVLSNISRGALSAYTVVEFPGK